MKKKYIFLTIFLWIVSVDAVAQLSNSDFESWENELPSNWKTSEYGAGKSTDAYSGSAAISVWNWYTYALGYTVNGNFNNFGIYNFYEGGVPIEENPILLTGYYKYILENNGGEKDSAEVHILLKKYNTQSHEIDTISHVLKKLGPESSYTFFEIKIPTSTTQADSIVVAFTSGTYGCRCAGDDEDGQCLYLYVDDLALSTTTGIIPAETWMGKGNLYPNPFSDYSIINLGEENLGVYSLTLYNASGLEVRHLEKIFSPSVKIEKNDLLPGIYFFKAKSEKGEIRGGKFIVE